MTGRQEDLFFVEEEIPTWQIARALGWTPKRTRRVFQRAKIAHQLPGSAEWLVLRSDLVRLMPEVDVRLRELKEHGRLGMPGRARPGNRNRNRLGTKRATDEQ